MQMRDAAERVLFSNSLEGKLKLSPENATDDSPGPAVVVPDAPARPDELSITAKGVRAEFPGINKLDDDAERGKMLHFLANHELLAAELMALVLLKFPDAPKEYRRGVYEAMREEQMHAQMYLRRMRDCGIHFGELPVNDYFWRLIAPMETPLDFVTRLNLTFEQANLDFSKHYASLFRQVGDTGTAAVLEKIYLDEIGHVGHGVKWFRRWKQQGETDWQAFGKHLTFPLAPAKAKGMAPFNAEGRRLAGLDEDFIARLEVCEQSRGRTPVLHWYNPLAEAFAADANYQSQAIEQSLENDLELLTIAWCRRDDMLLLRKHPGNEHLMRLKNVGLHLPEIITLPELSNSEVKDRKLGGLRPWAWSPDASKLLSRLSNNVSNNAPWRWRKPLPSEWLGKHIGAQLQEVLEVTENPTVFCITRDETLAETEKQLTTGPVLLKANHACAGRGHRTIKDTDGATSKSTQQWITSACEKRGGVVAEPLLDRVLDFSALYEMDEQGARFLKLSRMENDAHGGYLATHIDRKWGSGMDRELREFIFQKCDFALWYRAKIPAALESLLPNYIGPVGVDAMVFRQPDGTLALRPVIELNVRMTMGRVAYELHRKLSPNQSGKFSILRRKKLTDSQLLAIYSQDINTPIPINNPHTAKDFIAIWQSQA